MAKKKEKNKVTSLDEKFEKQFGEGIIVTGNYVVNAPQVIVPVSPQMDVMLGGGIPFGSFVIPTGPPKVGKMQPLDSAVFTRRGQTTVGDVKRGDLLCNGEGGVSTVVNVFEHENRKIYKVTFNDGSEVKCGLDHLWKTKTRFYGDWHVLCLRSMFKQGLIEADGRYKWQVPLSKCYFDSQHVSIDPYLLGVLLGDGCITKNISLTSQDPEIVESCNELLKVDNCCFKKVSSSNIEHYFYTNGAKNIYKERLKAYGLLGKNSHTKFIPQDYLINSIDNRWSLLQGLLDTDGTVNKTGNPTYTTVSKKLADDVAFLVRSLGGLCKVSVRYTSYDKVKFFKSYRLSIRFNDYSKCFRLHRKSRLVRNRTKKPLNRKIASVEFHSIEDARCFELSGEKTYLTNGFVVTHNTSMALSLAANALSIPTEWDMPRRLHFFNIEGRLNKRDLLGIHNMKQHLEAGIVKVYTSRPGRILTAENYLEMGEAYINEEPGSIFIFDSFSQLCSKKGREKEWDEKEYRDNVPKFLSMFCKRISNVIPINKCIVIGVTHRIADTGFGFSSWAEASGTKIQYQVDVKLKAWSKDWMEGGEGSTTKIGKNIEWECLCSPLHNGPCETKCESKLRFGYGIDKPMELVDAAIDLGIISVGGSWYTLPDGEKVQGKDKARNFLADPENLELLNSIDKQYREMMGLPNAGV